MKRRGWILLGSVIALLAAIVLAGLPVYVFPPEDEITTADAIFVLGPPLDPRMELHDELRADGLAEASLVSVDRGAAHHRQACRDGTATCKTPTPFTTAGEARLLADYLAARDMHSAIVITSTPHVARTRYIFDKCFGGDITVVGVTDDTSPLDWAYQYVYQTAGFVKAFFEPCPTR